MVLWVASRFPSRHTGRFAMEPQSTDIQRNPIDSLTMIILRSAALALTIAAATYASARYVLTLTGV